MGGTDNDSGNTNADINDDELFTAQYLAEQRKKAEDIRAQLKELEYQSFVAEYKIAMREFFSDLSKVDKPLDIWISLPDCKTENSKFERFIKEVGYVCKFCIYDPTPLRDNSQKETGYLIAEDSFALDKNKKTRSGKIITPK